MTRVLIIALAAAVLVPAAAWAQTIDPCMSDTPGILSLSPGGPPLPYQVEVRDTFGSPVAGAEVEVIFSNGAVNDLCWCPGATKVIRATAGPGGVAVFHAGGGGCYLASQYGNTGATVRARVNAASPWVTLRPNPAVNCGLTDITVNSPDVVDQAGLPPWSPGYAPFRCEVTLSDAVYLSGAIATGAIDDCAKFVGQPGTPVGLGDAVAVTPFIIQASHCP